MILAFDIGGSRIRAALWDGERMGAVEEAATPLHDLGAFVAALSAFVPKDAPRGVALSLPGVVDPGTGRGKVANIPCIDGLALAPLLAARLGLPVLALNDADCFALAEAGQGAGRGQANVLAVILGSGVGGGLVIGGQLVSGAGGFAGEWGHGPVLRAPFDFACGCGQRGCLDTVGSARGLERLFRHLGGGAADSRAIVGGWRAGDVLAARAVELWAELVSGPLALVVNTVGATVVPVGGGLSRAADLIALLDGRTRDRVLRRPEAPLVVPALCGADAGLLGAALAGARAWA